MTVNEKIKFRLFIMPCCQHSLCWVNPRAPSYCPECGKHVYPEVRSCATIESDGWLKVENATAIPLDVRRSDASSGPMNPRPNWREDPLT